MIGGWSDLVWLAQSITLGGLKLITLVRNYSGFEVCLVSWFIRSKPVMSRTCSAQYICPADMVDIMVIWGGHEI